MDHYVESDTGEFRLIYNMEKFRHATMPPGWKKELNVLVRSKANGKIMATIIGLPKKMVINGQN